MGDRRGSSPLSRIIPLEFTDFSGFLVDKCKSLIRIRRGSGFAGIVTELSGHVTDLGDR